MERPSAPAIAIYRGPQHVIVAANCEFLAAIDFDPVGLPAREAFPGHEGAQDAMDRVYRTGKAELFHEPAAVLLIEALRDASGQVWGIATAWRWSGARTQRSHHAVPAPGRQDRTASPS